VDPHLQSESDSEVDSENSQVDSEIPKDIEEQYRACIFALGLDVGEQNYWNRNPHFENCSCAF